MIANGSSVQGWHYDGRDARRYSVTARLAGGALIFEETGEAIPLADLVPLGDAARTVFGRRGEEGWRLGFDAPLPLEWRAALPKQEKHGGLLDRYGIVLPIVLAALVTGLFLVGLWQGAAIVARLVPERWEQGFGEALTGDFGGEACNGPGGQRAIDALAARLGDDGQPIKVRVIDLPMVNAAALPGRQIVLFRGLLTAAKSPDEVAGVLAHEIGHVANRDAMAGVIREYGVSLLFGVADGGLIARSLLSNSYTRAAEVRADDHAVAALATANISPAATAAFFDRLSGAKPSISRTARLMGYMASHPLSADRRALFMGSVEKGRRYAPAMTAAEWQAVRGMCGVEKKDRKAK